MGSNPIARSISFSPLLLGFLPYFCHFCTSSPSSAPVPDKRPLWRFLAGDLSKLSTPSPDSKPAHRSRSTPISRQSAVNSFDRCIRRPGSHQTAHSQDPPRHPPHQPPTIPRRSWGRFSRSASHSRRRRPAADLHDRLGGPSVPPAHDAQPRPPGRHAPSYEAGVAPALGSWRRRWPAPPPAPPSPIRLLPAGRPTTRPLPADGIVAERPSPGRRASLPARAAHRLPADAEKIRKPIRHAPQNPATPPQFPPQTPLSRSRPASEQAGSPYALPAPGLAGSDPPPNNVHVGGDTAEGDRTASFSVLHAARRSGGFSGAVGFGLRRTGEAPPRRRANSPPTDATTPSVGMATVAARAPNFNRT